MSIRRDDHSLFQGDIVTRVPAFNYDTLKRAYIYANTAHYLYKNFRSDESVKRLADKTNIEDLFRMYEEAVPEALNSVTDAVTVYALVIAISYKEYDSKVRRFFKQLDQCPLEWMMDLKDMLTAKVRSVISSTHSYVNEGSVASKEVSIDASTTTEEKRAIRIIINGGSS